MEIAMSSAATHHLQRELRDSIHAYWVLFLIHGVLMTVLGVLAIIWPQISTVAVDLYVGWMFLFSGAVGLIFMFMAPTIPAFVWVLLTSALSLFVGVLLLWHPVEGAVSLTLVLIAFFIAEGVFQIAAAVANREALPGSWGWMLMSGIADLLLAAIIISGWPGTASWALGLIVGVNLITSGVAVTSVALASRSVVRTIEDAAR
jgi:uncharacterized membrane protein HdeD (DUF308 family)